tara:strand:+ start:57 stop:1376 length:1320 start_codon:yes stop_codon:yes gene_type:complete
MAKKHVDALMKKALDFASDKWARSGVDKSKQRVTVTRHNLKEAFKEAFSKQHAKEFDNAEIPFKEPDKVFAKAATGAKNELLKHLERAKISNLVTSDANKVVFDQSRTTKTPFTRMKKGGLKVLEAELKSVGGKPLSGDQKQTIQRGMQRLHQGEVTVGIARLKAVINFLEKDELIGDKFTDSKLLQTIEDKFGEILAQFELVKDSKGRDTIRYKGQVGILVQRKGKNFPGSEHGDWTKVKKFLEKELTKWLEGEELADIPGSKSINDESVIHITNLVMSDLTKSSNVKARTRIPKMESKPKKGGSKRTPKVPGSVSKKKATVTRTKATKGVASDPLRLIGLINEKLPDTVARRMNPPALQNRTGRFAESVKLTEIIQTPQGFPSFGYTYQKNPYEVFEMGRGDAPWATPERDPRKIIDQSIRELAAQFAMGRFYTRRV